MATNDNDEHTAANTTVANVTWLVFNITDHSIEMNAERNFGR